MNRPVTTVALTVAAILVTLNGIASAQMNPQPPVMPTAPPPVDSKLTTPDAPPTPPAPIADPAPSADQLPHCTKAVKTNCVTKSGKVRKYH